MKEGHSLRTIDLARAAGISVQQVRNYEASGLIPPTERSPAGYRRYSGRHLLAITTARHLVGGYGWLQARRIMEAVQEARLDDALALIDTRHAELDRQRRQLAETLATLNLLTTQLAAVPQARRPQPLHVGEAAQVVGVRVSALRFWEEQGLLQPQRDKSNRYRLYDEQQIRRLRIVALLRQANHDFAAIRATLEALDAGRLQRAVAAIEQRRGEVARASWRCIRALAAFHGYIDTYHGELSRTEDPVSAPPEQAMVQRSNEE